MRFLILLLIGMDCLMGEHDTPRYSHDVSRYRLATDERIELSVMNLGLACCALEFDAAVADGLLIAVDAADSTRAAGASTVLVVAGTVTEPFAEVVRRTYEECASAGEVSVLAFGACASTGGPYWDAPSVIPGADRLVPVRAYVPGCPPNPEALVSAIAELAATC